MNTAPEAEKLSAFISVGSCFYGHQDRQRKLQLSLRLGDVASGPSSDLLHPFLHRILSPFPEMSKYSWWR